MITLGSKDRQYQHTACGITEMLAIDYKDGILQLTVCLMLGANP